MIDQTRIGEQIKVLIKVVPIKVVPIKMIAVVIKAADVKFGNPDHPISWNRTLINEIKFG